MIVLRVSPEQRIARKAIKVWRIQASIVFIIFSLIGTALLILGYRFDFSYWFGFGVLIITGLDGIISILIIPSIRWRRWRYQVYDQEIYIQHGIIIVKRTLVPMIRIQHVDTKQGPILRRFKLASLAISTAATTHEIPALSVEEAEQLRDQISILARVEQEDV